MLFDSEIVLKLNCKNSCCEVYMPTNLPPEAMDKWEEVEAAHTPERRCRRCRSSLVVFLSIKAP